MQIMTLIAALPGAVAQGLIWGIMAIGVYLTFRILDIADLTVDGTMCTGGAVCIMMMLSGHNVWTAMLAATIAGMLAGLVTGIFHTFMGIPAILAGILTQLSLYSINLKICLLYTSPLVTNPTISSPGIGLQHLEKRTATSWIPFTTMPLLLLAI